MDIGLCVSFPFPFLTSGKRKRTRAMTGATLSLLLGLQCGPGVMNRSTLFACNRSCKISWVYLCGDVLYLLQWDGLTSAQTKSVSECTAHACPNR